MYVQKAFFTLSAAEDKFESNIQTAYRLKNNFQSPWFECAPKYADGSKDEIEYFEHAEILYGKTIFGRRK